MGAKYDVENQKNDEQVSLSAEETEDADSLEEKMKQFHMGPSNKTSEIDHVIWIRVRRHRKKPTFEI